MTETTTAPDGTNETPTSNDDAQAEEVRDWGEVKKIIAERDKYRKQAKELATARKEMEKAQADAERAKAEADGDLRKQIELLQAERDSLHSQVDEWRGKATTYETEQRFQTVSSAVLSQIPDKANHAIATDAIREVVSRASDDGASSEELIAAALDSVKAKAPHFFQAPPEPQPFGMIPPDSARITPDQARRDTEARLRAAGFVGFKKVL